MVEVRGHGWVTPERAEEISEERRARRLAEQLCAVGPERRLTQGIRPSWRGPKPCTACKRRHVPLRSASAWSAQQPRSAPPRGGTSGALRARSKGGALRGGQAATGGRPEKRAPGGGMSARKLRSPPVVPLQVRAHGEHEQPSSKVACWLVPVKPVRTAAPAACK